MCGLVGYSGQGGSDIIRHMLNTVRHRGPDDQGVYTDQKVGLGHARLAVVDLTSAGHQPLSNEDETVVVAFNGEIYNHHALKKGLVQAHTFKGSADTEVIVHLYEEVGAQVFEALQGMFALALYDKKKKELYLARDRMGKKPLYWSVQNDTLIFGSELSALLQHPLVHRAIDRHSLNKYMQYGYVPTPHTILEGVYKLEPGSYLLWDGTRVAKHQFWKPTFLPKRATTDGAELVEALEEAVRVRLEADVPLGIFLSGGIDSSTIAYFASRLSGEAVKTFAIGFEDPTFDESSTARSVAAYLGTEHYEKIFSAHDCRSLIPDIGSLLDEPMADGSIVPTYLLSQFAREQVTVALGGDGGDELLCGYDTFLAHKLARAYQYIPSGIRTGIQLSVNQLPVSHRYMSADFKLKKFVNGFEVDHLYRNQQWLGAFDTEERSALFSSDVQGALCDSNVFEDIDRYRQQCDSSDMYDELGYLYQRTYMMDQVLVKVDRASMAHALEVRTPFLDTRVVDIANHLPTMDKLHGLTRKYALKKCMEGRLPYEIIHRKKKGFGMPIGRWFQDELRSLLTDVLSPTRLNRTGLFNADVVSSMVDEHISGRRDHRLQLWTLLVFMLWWDRHMA